MSPDNPTSDRPVCWPPLPWPVLEHRTRCGRRGWFSSVRVQRAALHRPLRWAPGRAIEVSPGQDLASAAVPRAALAVLLSVVAATPQHDYLLASTHPARLARLLVGSPNLDHTPTWPLSNLWLGTHVSTLHDTDLTDPALLATAGALWLDARRLRGPADIAGVLSSPLRDRITLVLTDPVPARPTWIHQAWASDVVEQCAAAGVRSLTAQQPAPRPRAATRVTSGVDIRRTAPLPAS